jgi:transposase-like protein
MPQIQLPIFPPGLNLINQLVGFEKKEGQVYYFYGTLPIFHHDEDDTESFRFITSQLVVSGNVKQIEIARAFGVPYISVKRSVKRLRQEGSKGFFKKRKGRSPHVLVPDVIEKAQNLLSKGYSTSEVAKQLDVKANTLNKAIREGRLHKKNPDEGHGCDKEELLPQSKSERVVMDAHCAIGLGCSREVERLQAGCGELKGAPAEFIPNKDVKSAGVLFALPSLLANGLLKCSENYFSLPKGYYALQSLLLTLAFVALLRIKSIEKVRYTDPAELGKLIGLDRIPEVRTLRQKIKYLSGQGDPEGWERELAKSWMQDSPDLAGVLYIDGHVRVYHGKQTKLPKRYVAREKLCLRGVTDYWINDRQGQPFFVVTQAETSGLLSVLRNSIVVQLLEDVPNQPSEEELEKNGFLYRFSLVFDREGYSPGFFKEMWDKNRIACYTYQKYVKDDWPEYEFKETEVVFQGGQKKQMKLAERGHYFKKEKLWVRQIRKLTATGHQTALMTTDYYNETAVIAGTMFSRWSQENFLKYMMEHYGINKLIDYDTEEMDDTIKVVNPRYRELDSQIRSKNAKLSRNRARYAAFLLEDEIEEKNVQEFVQKKAELKEIIELLDKEAYLIS